MSDFATIHPVTQLELEGFAQSITNADDAQDGAPLTYKEIREREMAARIALGEKLEGGEIPTWAEKFNNLLYKNVPWKIAAYVAWASTPHTGRWPKTQDEFAREVLGLNSDRRIAEWRKKYPTIDIMIANLQSDEFLEDRADVLYAVKTMAKRLDYKSAKYADMFLTMTGDLVKTTKLEAALRKRGITKDDLVDMTDAELDVLASALKNQIVSQDNDEDNDDGDDQQEEV